MPVDSRQDDGRNIKTAGWIQPAGALIAVSDSWVIRYASANAALRLKLSGSGEDLLGQWLLQVFSEHAIHTIRGRLQALQDGVSAERILGLPLVQGGEPANVTLHRRPKLIVIEWEPQVLERQQGAPWTIKTMASRLASAATIKDFFAEAIGQIKALTRFEQVAILGIEQEANAAGGLYEDMPTASPPREPGQGEEGLLHVIGDVDAPPVPVLARASEPLLDLSLCMLRPASAGHAASLRARGVRSALLIPLQVDDRLWGVIACHQKDPHAVSHERCAPAELLAQMISLLLERRQREEARAKERQAQAIQERLLTMLAATPAGNAHLKAFLGEIRATVACDGAALWTGGDLITQGETLSPEAIVALASMLEERQTQTLVATCRFGDLHPKASAWLPKVAGLLAIPVSRTPGDYLMLFRRELEKTRIWLENQADEPVKAVSKATEGGIEAAISLANFEETVIRGECAPWSSVDMQIAERYRATMLEVIMRLNEAAGMERAPAQARQERLIAELNNQVDQILGVIRRFVEQGQKSASSPAGFAAALDRRIEALARARRQIMAHPLEAAPLHGMIEAAIEVPAPGGAATQARPADRTGRIVTQGPAVLLEPRAFLSLALVVHELMTNSERHGALCGAFGQVEISWLIDGAGDLQLRWIEEGPAEAPARRGFYGAIIEDLIAFELGGRTILDHAPAGLRVALIVPARHVRPIGEVQASAAHLGKVATDRPEVSLQGRALLVEDTMVIALDAEEMLRSLGAREVDIAASVGQALELVQTAPPDFALVDIDLGHERGFQVADWLIKERIPFVFTVGQGEDCSLPRSCHDMPIVQKPYDRVQVQRQLLRALAMIQADPAIDGRKLPVLAAAPAS